jgi:hypothetical protein
MSQFPHDEFAKDYFESLLSPIGTVATSLTIKSQSRQIDVYFTPNGISPPADLGLLQQCAKTKTVFEPFRNTVTGWKIRNSLLKLYELHAGLFREAKRLKNPEPSDADLQNLWIVTPTLSDDVLNSFGAQLDETIVPTGVYLLPPGFKAGIIVVHQLPKTPATLWLRMLGKGKTQERAIEEIVRLSADHPYRRDVLDLLANLKAALEAQNSTEPEEQELVMKLSPIYLADLADAEENGRKEGRKEGSQEGRQAIVLRQISRRVGNLSPTIEAQIKALSIERLEELGDDLLDFQKVEDLINWLA